jgi:glutathione S-transferase
MPVLDIDGEVIGDTTEIIAALERRNPDPPLYPDTAIERKAALELEEHFDEELGPGLRSAIFHAILPDRQVTVGLGTQGLAARHRVVDMRSFPCYAR